MASVRMTGQFFFLCRPPNMLARIGEYALRVLARLDPDAALSPSL
ncbi:MAG: hypothetical protein ACUVWX_13395 [Kiritimatiellia bacterium]